LETYFSSSERVAISNTHDLTCSQTYNYSSGSLQFFFWEVNFDNFVNFFLNVYSVEILFLEKVSWKKFKKKKTPKVPTTTYDMKGCLRFFYFHIFNIAKFVRFGQIFLWMIVIWITSQNWKKETIASLSSTCCNTDFDFQA
jgi:hypothetical protein